MSFGDGLVGLLLYSTQQVGIMFAVGAETILLVGYLLSMRDGFIDSKEAQFARAIRRVLSIGFWLIVISGALVTVGHLMSGQMAVVLSAPFLFKWILISIAYYLRAWMYEGTLSERFGQGLAGGTWIAIFVIHILAPIVSWGMMLLFYLILLVGFFICWEILCAIMQGKPGDHPAPSPVQRPHTEVVSTRLAPTLAPSVAPISQPVQEGSMQRASGAATIPIPRPPVKTIPVAAQVSAPAPVPLPSRVAYKAAELPHVAAPTPTKPQMPPIPPPPPASSLPTIRVMPRSEDDLTSGGAAKVVQYN